MSQQQKISYLSTFTVVGNNNFISTIPSTYSSYAGYGTRPVPTMNLSISTVTFNWGKYPLAKSYVFSFYQNTNSTIPNSVLLSTFSTITSSGISYTNLSIGTYYSGLLQTYYNNNSVLANKSFYDTTIVLPSIPAAPSTPAIIITSASNLATISYPFISTASAYTISLYQNSISTNAGATLFSTLSTKNLSITFSTLSNYYYYYSQVAASNSAGNGPFTQSFYIPSSVPAPVASATLNINSADIPTVTWLNSIFANNYYTELWQHRHNLLLEQRVSHRTQHLT